MAVAAARAAFTCTECRALPLWMRLFWHDEGAEQHQNATGHHTYAITAYGCASDGDCSRSVETDGEVCRQCVEDDRQDQEITALMATLGAIKANDGTYRDPLGRAYRPIYEARRIARIIRQRRKLHRWSIDMGGHPGTNAITVWERIDE
jgi:hypothetical protein